MDAGGEYRALALLAAVALDLVYPRHYGVLYLVHPVRLSFIAARRLARPYSGVARGLFIWISVTTMIVAPVALALYALSSSWVIWALVSAIILKFSMALRLLVQTALRVAEALRDERLADARRLVGEIVRRPTGDLGPGLVSSAAIESLAENLVDGYTSPLTYYPILGPVGSLLQRTANTLDGAIGYKTPEYERVGKPAAYADTLLNYAPARLTALFIILLAPIVGGSIKGAISIWLRWRGATESFNAGHPIAAIAGALGVRLEKPGHYVINPGGREPTHEDIVKAVRLAVSVAVIYTLAVVALVLVLH